MAIGPKSDVDWDVMCMLFLEATTFRDLFICYICFISQWSQHIQSNEIYWNSIWYNHFEIRDMTHKDVSEYF